MGQRTLKESDLPHLVSVLRDMKPGDLVTIKKQGGTKWSVRRKIKKQPSHVDIAPLRRKDSST
jgi:16S rRNA U1498 N3-methylase RsmE